MKRFCVGLIAILLTSATARADGAAIADGVRSGCGGDAYSFVDIVPPGAKEPLVAVPDTLCADLASSAATRIESLNIYLDGRSNEADQRQRPWRGLPAPHRRY